jgi:uncharacterized protein (TIRG00374 family)
MVKSILTYLFSTILAIGLLYWAFSSSHLEWEDIYQTLQQADYRWVSLAIFISLLSHWLRALRWQQLLGALHHHPGVTRTLSAVLIGYFANFIVPRMGEVSRCGSLTKTAGIPFEKSFGTVITERVVDLLCLLILVGLVFFVGWEPIQQNLFPQFQVPSLPIWIGLGLVGMGTLFFLWRKRELVAESWTKFANSSKIGKIIDGWLSGIISIKDLENPFLFIIYTLGIWLAYFANTYILLLAFPASMHLGMDAGLIVLVLGTFGMATPTQGGIGAYHKLVAAALVFYHIPLKEATVLATFFHGTQMATILFFGGLSFILTLFLPKINLANGK